MTRGIVPALAAIAALAACGDDARPGGAADAHVDTIVHLPDGPSVSPRCTGAVPVEDLASCLTLALCRRATACGLGAPGDSDCAALDVVVTSGVRARTLAITIVDSVGHGRSTYDPIAAGACLAGVDAWSCKALHASGGAGVAAAVDACGIFVGQAPPSASCALSFECQAGFACVQASGNQYTPLCGEDVCKARVSAGASCAASPCEVGDHCVSGTCASGELDAPCAGDGDCDAGFFCGDAGTCAAALAADAACTRDRMCAGELACVGDALVPAAGTCRDVSTAGASCDGACFGPYLCAVPDPTQLGTCVAEPGVAAACVPGGGCGAPLSALGFLRCDDRGTPDPGDDVCAMPGDVGAACKPGGGACDVGLVCTADVNGTALGVCRAPLAIGTACTADDQCASGSCRDRVCETFQPCQLGGLF